MILQTLATLLAVCVGPQVIALDLIRAPNLAKGLVESAGARLQHLQLVADGFGPNREVLDGFWGTVKACTELAALQLVFQPRGMAPMDQQVASPTVQLYIWFHKVLRCTVPRAMVHMPMAGCSHAGVGWPTGSNALPCAGSQLP